MDRIPLDIVFHPIVIPTFVPSDGIFVTWPPSNRDEFDIVPVERSVPQQFDTYSLPPRYVVEEENSILLPEELFPFVHPILNCSWMRHDS